MTEAQKTRLAELSRLSANALSNAQKKELAELQARQAESAAAALETTNTAEKTPLTDATPGGSGVVYVFANLESPQSFRLADGADVVIDGVPVTQLRTLEGGFYPGGKFGVTSVPAAAWAEVERVYGKMKMFTNGLIFSAPTLEIGRAMARERGELRHGFEPVDPNSARTKTSPATPE